MIERRTDNITRKRVAEMSPEEMRRALKAVGRPASISTSRGVGREKEVSERFCSAGR
jgi:hypothetical protein